MDHNKFLPRVYGAHASCLRQRSGGLGLRGNGWPDGEGGDVWVGDIDALGMIGAGASSRAATDMYQKAVLMCTSKRKISHQSMRVKRVWSLGLAMRM